jgi:hypothetical protein
MIFFSDKEAGVRTTAVYDTYWRFAFERQAVYLRRMSGRPGPWTGDPILRAYRFTNAYRAADRVSQYLIAEVQGRTDRSQAPDELVFRTLLFKIFNRIDTWELLESYLGPMAWQSVNLERLLAVLDRRFAAGGRLYSAAYIMPSPPFGAARKHANHLALLHQIMTDGLPAKLARAPSLQALYDLIRPYPGLGPFLAFQYAIDLNYSELTPHGEADFVVAGPGAVDGIAKCFHDTGGRSPEQIIHLMVERQDIEFARLDLPFEGLFGRRLQPIDCQNLFCEISKYARVAHPEISGVAGRTRIKQGFRAAPRALAPPCFPPKWNLAPPMHSRRPPSETQMSLF